MEKMKRLLSLLLCLMLLVGVLPVGALAEEGDGGDDTEYLFVATDRHGNTSIIGNIITSMEKDVGVGLDYLALGGDMVGSGNNHPQYNSSTVLNEASTADSGLTAENVNIVAGIHDQNVNDDAGIVLLYKSGSKQLYEGKNFYVYGVEEYCVSDASTAQTEAAKFVTWAEGIDSSKAIIVVSHYPLHAKRGDNKGAGYWHNALNTVATGSATGTEIIRDVVFFHGHNHTTDKNEYCYAPGSTLSIQSYVSPSGVATQSEEEVAVYDEEYETYATVSGTSATIYYTYATAGYLNSNQDATLVAVDGDSITLTKYDTSGSKGVMTTVTRVAGTDTGDTDSTEPENTDPTEPENTDPTEPENTDPTEPEVTDPTEPEVTDPTEPEVTDPTEPDGDNALKDESTGVTVSGSNATEIAVTETTNDTVAATLNGILESYVAYDITLTGYTAGTVTTVTLPIPVGVTDPAVYYVPESGEAEALEITGKTDTTVTFVTDHFSVYAVGQAATRDGSDDREPVDVTVESGAGTSVQVWKLTNTLTNGGTYLIVNGNSAGSYHALTNNSDSIGDTTVTVATDDNSNVYISDDSAAEGMKWTASGSGTSWSFANSGKYLSTSDSIGSHSLTLSNDAKNWTLGTNTLSYTYTYTYTIIGTNTSTYYLQYESSYGFSSAGWKLSSTSSNVYFYELSTITSGATEGGIYSIAGENVNRTVVAGDTAALKSTLTFTGGAGTTNTTDVSTQATYEVVEGTDIITVSGNTATFTGKYGEATVKVSYEIEGAGTVVNYFTVTAGMPEFTVDIVDSGSESITNTVVIKGEEAMNAGYQLSAKVSYTTDGESKELQDVDSAKVSWMSNNAAVATVDATGKVTFVGEGSAQITVYYEYADGQSVTDTVTFSVSKSSYIIPSDGTNDFPKYPNEGAVRFDKTASAVGSFSQTGIAQVELSMTGVPYSTGSEIDVVLMLDMTGSMTETRRNATKAAAKAFLEKIVKNEDGSYNGNRIAIYSFNKAGVNTICELARVESDSALSTIETAIDALSTTSGSTPYADAMKQCYDTLNSAKTDGTGNDRKQFCLFMSDGVPTKYQYNASSYYITSDIQRMFGGNNYNTRNSNSYKYEYYSTQMKATGVTVYTVGLGLNATNNAWDGKTATQCLNAASILLNDISGPGNEESQPDGLGTTTLSKKDTYFFSVEDASNAEDSKMLEVFESIAVSIREAATDVKVVDKIADEYTMNFKLPSGVSSTDAGMSEFYIQVVEYTLDGNHERTGNLSVLENFTFNDDGTLQSHTVGGAACSGCTHVTTTDGTITKIQGTYFTYESTANGEFLTWTAEKLTSNELALQYFVYLEDSAGTSAADQVAAGTYPTNEYATLTYTNHLGHEVQQNFPVPQLTWNGAQVTYVFYLVNENGQPVNRAGKVVPFAEAVYVTDPVTFAVTWNKEGTQGENKLEAGYLAQDIVPDIYRLYDEKAEYTIHVYETEKTDGNTGKSNSFFVINGDEENGKTSSTTKVFNTKAGSRYDAYKTYYSDEETGFDFYNTTVAFAVVWTAELKEDVVVIDFGLDVVIDVIANDTLAATVTGVLAELPANMMLNSGTAATTSGKGEISGDFWKATSESGNNNAVRFSLTDTTMNDAVTFYYEAGVNYYKENVLQTAYMYSSVTVIPATTIYYEDSFLTLSSCTKGDDGEYNQDKETKWVQEGQTLSNAKQDVDRPGFNQVKEGYDANNVYGYDSAYTDCSLHSLGSARYIDVTADIRGEATFDFYGTGFDVIGLTSNTTGTLIIQVKNEAGGIVKTTFVDTYYGYAYKNGEWVIVDNADPDALYQVPVMKISGLDYGLYSVTLIAGYNKAFDHTSDVIDGYRLYLDAIRIYDPVGVVSGVKNETVSDAYAADKELDPQYIELRNHIIEASEYKVAEDGTVTGEKLVGAIFIDGIKENTSISNYVSYGPNNELYLTKDQSVAFTINKENAADIQIALKLASGESVACTINEKEFTITSATDLYYSILSLIKADGRVTITNTSDAILSITNIKITHSTAGAEATALYMDGEGATAVVQSLMAIGRTDGEKPTVPETPTEETPTETPTEETPTETPSGETEAPTEETEAPTEETEAPTEEPKPDNDRENVIEVIVTGIAKAIGRLFKKWWP